MNQEHVAKFAGVVARAWADPEQARHYHANPHEVLRQHGIDLPDGVPAPVIPEHPAGSNYTQWAREMSFKDWDVKITNYPNIPQNSPLGVSSLACGSCPVACFSSLSN